MTTLITKTTFPFCHEWQRVRVSSRHLINTGRASISIILIIESNSIIIIILILRSLWSRWRKSNEATNDRLASCNTTNMSVHLTQLISESVKASIHALKLCHDVLKSHTARRRSGSKCGWSWRSGRSCWLRPPRLKLCLAPFNGSGIYSTHNKEVVRQGEENRKMAYPHDSIREDELIMGRRIPIHIYDRKNEIRGKIYTKML